MTEKCNLDGVFEKVGELYVVRNIKGEPIPVLFCPMCGQKIDYDGLRKG